MYIVYCIEDINDIKYVGITKKKINQRFNNHIYDKYDTKKKGICSSVILHLEHSIIYPLEINISSKDKKERERYWIDKIDCINKIKLDGGNFNYKEYRDKNKDRIQKVVKLHNDKFRELNPDYNKIWSAKKWYCECCRKEYNRSSKSPHLKSKTHIIQSIKLSDLQE